MRAQNIHYGLILLLLKGSHACNKVRPFRGGDLGVRAPSALNVAFLKDKEIT